MRVAQIHDANKRAYMSTGNLLATPRPVNSDWRAKFHLGKKNKRRSTELGLLIISIIITVSAYVVASLGKSATIPSNIIPILAALLALSLTAHVGTRKLAPNADPIMLPVASLLNGLGFVMITRIDYHEAILQAIWSAVGVAGYLASLYFIRNSAVLDRYRYLLGAGGIALLMLPLVPKLGININGVRLWIHLGPLTFQPVEAAKLLLAVFFASYFVEKRELLGHPIGGDKKVTLIEFRALGPIFAAWGISLLIMTAERDVGFSLLIFLIFIITLWLATSRKTYLILGSGLFGLGTIVASIIFSHVRDRLVVWLNPWKYASTIGYQLIQGQFALGYGGVGGTGLGRGHPTIIPVVASDYIFAAIGEEMGLLGTTAIVFAFLILVGAGLRAALRAKNDFSKLLAASFTAIIGLQSFFIMAGIVRLLPLTGVTLPFVAYGGSSLVANYVLISILMRISHEGNVLQ